MRDPAADAPHGEDGCKALAREAERLEQQSGIEFDIRLQGPVRLAPRQDVERSDLDAFGQSQSSVAIRARTRQPPDGAFQRVGAGIAHAIDPMAEAHQAVASIQGRLEPSLGRLRPADPIRLVGQGPGPAARQRSFKALSAASALEVRPAWVEATTRAA